MIASKMSKEASHLRAETAANCWLCDRDRGELCHVHERSGCDAETDPGVVWVVPVAGHG